MSTKTRLAGVRTARVLSADQTTSLTDCASKLTTIIHNLRSNNQKLLKKIAQKDNQRSLEQLRLHQSVRQKQFQHKLNTPITQHLSPFDQQGHSYVRPRGVSHVKAKDENKENIWQTKKQKVAQNVFRKYYEFHDQGNAEKDNQLPPMIKVKVNRLKLKIIPLEQLQERRKMI